MPTGGAFSCPSTGAPVVDNEVKVLCDAVGVPFLRRYTIDPDGAATFIDTTLDGQTTFTPVEPIGVCGSTAEESPGEPCDETTPVATVGLCLADSSPIAVTIERACDGTVARVGWVDLATGAVSEGAPPAGTRACGETSAFDVSGAFCDIDPATGDVLAIVLVEVERGTDGEITGTRLINPVDGSEYMLQGELSVCPAGVEQPERDLVLLCDVAADGTVTQFVRDYSRDENGAIVGHSDYTLDGATYLPGPTVALCPARSECSDCQTVQLCDFGGRSYAELIATAGSGGTLSNNVTWTARGTNAPWTTSDVNADGSWWKAPLFPNIVGSPLTWLFDRPVWAEFSVAMRYDASGGAGANTVQLPPNVEPVSLPAGYTYDEAAGTVTVDSTVLDCPPVIDPTQATSARFRTSGPVQSLTVDYLGPRVAVCGEFYSYQFGAVEVTPASVPFLRTVCRDCDGVVASVTDTTLDGQTVYDPAGPVGVCPQTVDGSVSIDGPIEVVTACQECDTVTLCDINDQPAPVEVAGGGNTGTAGNGVAWTTNGGSDSTEPNWWMVSIFPAGFGDPLTYTFTKPVSVQWSARVGQNVIAEGDTGQIRMPEGTRLVELHPLHEYDPDTRVLSALPGADADDPAHVSRFSHPGPVTSVAFEQAGPAGAAQDGPASRRVGDLLIVAYPTPFLRTVCRDCDGTVTAITSTELDGVTDYDPAGVVSVCTDAAVTQREPGEPCQECDTVVLCDDEGIVDGVVTFDAVAGQNDGIADNGVGWVRVGPDMMTGFPTSVWLRSTESPGERFTFDRSVLAVTYSARGLSGSGSQFTIPAGHDPVTIHANHVWDPATRILSNAGTATQEDVSVFRVGGPMSGFAGPVGSVGGSFPEWGDIRLSARQVSSFLQTTCRDCDGVIVSTSRTTLDGATDYEPAGEVVDCASAGGPAPAGVDVEVVPLCDVLPDGTVVEFLRHFAYDDGGAVTAVRDTLLDGETGYDTDGTVSQCQPVDCQADPICVRPSGVVEFISNADNNTNAEVDPVWTWSLGDTDGPWFDMYQVGVFPGWTVTDPGTPGGTARWVAPHPDSGVANTGLPGEGPTLESGNGEWYARASFELPAFADPASIRVAATILNADQLAVEWRLNAGDWQPVNAAHNTPPYTLPPTDVPGAQAGVNDLFVHVSETVFGSGAAGVIMHLVATYDVAPEAFEQWARVTCTDGTVYYLDPQGDRQDAIPADSTIVPCPGGGETGSPTPVCYTAPTTPPVTCDNVTVSELTSPQITDAVAVENPQGWGIRPESTYNGDTSAAGGPPTGLGVINCNDFEGDTGVVLDYTITPPASNVTGVNLWNAFGNSIADLDGIGSGTLTLLDTDGNTLFTGPLNACRPASGDFATPCLTDLGGQVDGVATMRLSNLAKVPQAEGPNPDIGWREIALVTADYEALLTAECDGQQVTATVEGAAAGLTYAAGQLTQTAGPHTLTWHVPAGYAGTIVTNTPAAFDRLDFTNGTVVTVSGDGTVSFAVEVGLAADGGVSAGFVTLDPVTGLPTVRDANTGQVVPGAVIVPCCCDGDGGTGTPSDQLLERCGCDDTDGDGIGDVRYTELYRVPLDGAAPVLIGTYLEGDLTDPYLPVNPVDCPPGQPVPDESPGELSEPLLTGARNITGAAPQDIAADHPTLQSVTLTVLAGQVLASLDEGAGVLFPAGTSHTWSVQKDLDAVLSAAEFAGADPAANYLLVYTFRE